MDFNGLLIVISYLVFVLATLFQLWHARKRTKGWAAAAVERDELRQRVSDLTSELERAREVAQDERSKRERYFEKISDFERERSRWQKSYYEQSIGHGNAQELMMNTIEGLATQVKALGGRPKIPNVIHAVREEFIGQHELPSREATKKAVSESPSPEEPPVPPDAA